LNDKEPLFSNEPADENIVGAPNWPKIEAEYRAGKPLRAISAQFGIGKNAISRKAKQEGWQKSATSPGQDAGQTPERGAKSDVVPPPSQDDETFDWDADDLVVLHEQPRTALYFNRNGALVIRQQDDWAREGYSFVFIAEEYIESFVEKLTDLIGIPLAARKGA
jgi:hypothetical protein